MDASVEQFKHELEQSIIKSNVVAIFDYLVTIAVEVGASDIHIEAFESFSRIRIRIDGVMEELVQVPKSLHESIISKFKIESGQMRPDEKRLPQDARVSTITKTNKEIDLRASTLPTIHGEKLVMRIVDKSKKIPPLNKLGVEGTNEEKLMRALTLPNGIILTTGPTGSGKTNTLYACLDYINKIEVNILTFEDPVENKMFGLNQAQVRSDIDFTFASGLRAALRQDPDIIMVGEIRDYETLDMAMEAAMTGHLVFSTIHTNSSSETLTRVSNLGAKPFMVAGTFNLVMAQRLARTVCPHCPTITSVKGQEWFEHAKEAFVSMDKTKLSDEVRKRGITQEQRVAFMQEGNMKVWSGKDPQTGDVCPVCGGSGFKGRIGVFEFMEYHDDLKNMLINNKTAIEIEKYELERGMIDLERDGILKVIKGQITLSEVYRLVKHRR